MSAQAAWYQQIPVAAAHAPAAERMQFIRKTYAHLGAAIVAFMLLEWMLVGSSVGNALVSMMISTRLGWVVVLGAFILVGNLAERFARTPNAPKQQYLGLGAYVVAEAIIFLPLITIAQIMAGPEVLVTAAVVTLVMFGGLTAAVFISGENFNWLRGALTIGSLAALATVLCAAIFGFDLGILFSGAMVLLACGYILYYTSKVMREFPVGSHVAAALALFAAVALLFWYVLRIFLSRRR